MSESTQWSRAAQYRRLVQRIDALPPSADPANRRYWCPTCGFLTHAVVTATPDIHEIATPDRWITRADLEPIPEGHHHG